MNALSPSLLSAAKLAIAHDNIPAAINHARWAATFRCSVGDVEEAFKVAENGSRKLPEEIAAQAPHIPESSPEGK